MGDLTLGDPIGAEWLGKVVKTRKGHSGAKLKWPEVEEVGTVGM